LQNEFGFMDTGQRSITNFPENHLHEINNSIISGSVNEDTTWSMSYDSPIDEIGELEVYDDYLFASGEDFGFGNGHLFYYDGNSWFDTDFSTLIGVEVMEISALKTFNNRLYIGTKIYNDDNYYARIYYYDGINYVQDFSTTNFYGYSGIEDMTIHNGDLYATNGSIGEVYRRENDNEWTTLVLSGGSPVRCLASYNGTLYAGTGGQGDNAEVWFLNNESWSLLINLSDEFNTSSDTVLNLSVAYNKLFASTGGPQSSSPIHIYDGSSWTTGTSITGCNSAMMSIVNDELWIGSCNGIVMKYDNHNWTMMGNTGELYNSHFKLFHNFIFVGTYGDGIIYSTEIQMVKMFLPLLLR